jgi:DNA segregation ATPase FtsK/SpoIIIE, S-DNA-T family
MTATSRVSLDKKTAAEVAVLQDAEVEEAVLEGEIVDPPRAPIATVRAVVTDVAAHHRTQTVLRHGLYVAGGAAVVVKRLWDGRTTARYERMMRAAEAAGDREAVLEWEARGAAFRKDRHQRRTEMIELVMRMVLAAPKMALCGVVGLLVLGVLISIGAKDARYIPVPLIFVGHVLALVALVVSVAWGPLLLAAPWIAVGALYLVGKSHAANATGWMARFEPEAPDAGVVVTADAVVLALQHLRIPEMKKAFKDGFVPVFRLTPIRDGRGYHTIVDLPLGVTAAMVADQRPVLARNMHRAEVETWPSDAEKVGTGPAGCLDMWVADPGALSKAAPEYPLLHEGTADVFKGVPGGVSPRGDALMIPIIGKNVVAGGQMGQGKSNACRVILLGCALDPICEIDAFVFAANGDFDAYRPRLSHYERGVDDETAWAALERLRWLYGEVARREARLAELGAKKVTRGLAEKHDDLRPIVSLYSECHELFGHPEVGEEAGELACKTAKRARKTAIVLGFDTQSSRKEAIPPKLVELMSVNVCFYVKAWRSNDGFLGDGAFQAGIRATELRPGRDVGTSITIGVSDNTFELLKWYFVEVNDDTGFDAAADVIARAVANLAPGTPAGGAPPEVAEPEERDLLDDLDEVLGHERVRLADVPALLRDLAPEWRPYRPLTGKELRGLLREEGVRTVKTGNVAYLDPAEVRREVAERATADLDDAG